MLQMKWTNSDMLLQRKKNYVYKIKFPTCVDVARYFRINLVLIKSGLDNPGQSVVICLIAKHPSKGKSVEREKTYLLFGATPAYILVDNRWLIPAVISGVNNMKTFRSFLVLFPRTSTNSILQW